jgi:hypothetical protein
VKLEEGIIKELIRLCLKYREEVEPEPRLTATAIQKVLYRLKCELPESNKIKRQLPYYWFKAGAYSPYVYHMLEDMQHKVLSTVRKTHRLRKSDYRLYTLTKKYKNKRLCKHDSDFIKASNLLRKIVLEIEPFSLDKEIRFQYQYNAPSPFYPRFKLEFLPSLQQFYNTINKMPTYHACDQSISIQQDTLLKLLNLASSSLPFSSIFSHFKH